MADAPQLPRGSRILVREDSAETEDVFSASSRQSARAGDGRRLHKRSEAAAARAPHFAV